MNTTNEGRDMSEPASGAAGAALGWKLIGGLAGVLGFGAAVASTVVMLMTQPRSPREWAVGLISTVLGSIAGGAYAVIKLELLAVLHSAATDVEMFTGLCAILGVAFACGLPAWAAVRWVFTYLDRRRDADIMEIAAEVKKQMEV